MCPRCCRGRRTPGGREAQHLHRELVGLERPAAVRRLRGQPVAQHAHVDHAGRAPSEGHVDRVRRRDGVLRRHRVAGRFVAHLTGLRRRRAGRSASSRTPNWMPLRGSSMCTTAGTPSNSTSSTAGARRSIRSSFRRLGSDFRHGCQRVVGDDVARVGAHVQVRPARDRPRAHQEAGDRAGRPLQALLACGVRIVRSASSTSSRTYG